MTHENMKKFMEAIEEIIQIHVCAELAL